MKGIMDESEFYKLVKQAKELGAETISVFGFGEPLLDPGLAKKIAFCFGLDLKTFITTNGSLMRNNLMYDLLHSQLSHVRFSVHGLWDDYNKIHKGLRFEDTLRNIANFCRVNDEKFGHPCKVGITVIPMLNQEIEPIVDFWSKFKIDELEIWRPHNWTNGKEYRKKTPKRKKTCGRPHRGPVQINMDGKVMVCCFDYDAKMVVGDTRKHTIEEILKGDKFNAIRKAHETGDLRGLPCEACDQLNIEEESPLLYSNVDPARKVGKTSSTKFNLEE